LWVFGVWGLVWHIRFLPLSCAIFPWFKVYQRDMYRFIVSLLCWLIFRVR
jgi:hypothetical protein